MTVNLDAEIERFRALGFRLDMISPADDPREALVSRDGEQYHLRSHPAPTGLAPRSSGEWVSGRAGMRYLDLVPDRLGGKVIASRIKLPESGDVADYAHYHKIDFQLIYCVSGAVKVVYEGQGEPFWLEKGEIILQPPEIRHRVLECREDAEVIEVTLPAEHETWVDHEISLGHPDSERECTFGGQRFVHSFLEELSAEDSSSTERGTISDATGGRLSVRLMRTGGDFPSLASTSEPGLALNIPTTDGTYLEVRLSP